MNSNELDELREKIDSIDTRIAGLFEQRMSAVRLIGEYKLAHGLPTEDAAREAEHINKTGELLSDKDLIPYWEKFLEGLFRISKEYQWTLKDGCPSRKK